MGSAENNWAREESGIFKKWTPGGNFDLEAGNSTTGVGGLKPTNRRKGGGKKDPKKTTMRGKP